MKRAVLIIVVLLAVFAGAVVTVRAFMPATPPPKKVEVVRSVKLDEQTVNLADTREAHYLKTTVDLRVSGTEPIETFTQQWNSVVLDGIIEILSARNYNSLLSLEGKRSLKQELRDYLNARLKDSGWSIKDIYFTEFVME